MTRRPAQVNLRTLPVFILIEVEGGTNHCDIITNKGDVTQKIHSGEIGGLAK